jgi:transposase
MSQMTLMSGPERRRRWTEEDRRRILAEAFAPGAKPTQVAQQHDVATSLLYDWRKQALQSRQPVAAFAAAVVVDDPQVPPTISSPLAATSPVIVVELAGVARVSIGSTATAALATAVLKALR